MRRFLVLSLLLPLLGTGQASATPAYSVDTEVLDAARSCRFARAGAVHEGATLPDGAGTHEPVLLVHGSDVTREQNWEWGYWQSLPALGMDVCWVSLPLAALGDMQISAEYVARAIERMGAETGEPVDVLGHSSGGVTPRWAVKYFPQAEVDDLVMLAAPHHGALIMDIETTDGVAYPTYWQLRTGSRLLEALNATDETPGSTSYTSIYTKFDVLLGYEGTAELDGASNVALQDVCPARPIDHFAMALDGLTYLLVIDALVHEGPADPDRLTQDRCQSTLIPVLDTVPTTTTDYEGLEETDAEPELRSYAVS